MQGLCKFGFYEVFKILYSDMLGEVRIQRFLFYCMIYSMYRNKAIFHYSKKKREHSFSILFKLFSSDTHQSVKWWILTQR